jgi:phosphoglycerate dehydrogenase-like enzyme
MPVDVIPAEPPVPTWPFPEGSSRLELDVSRVVFYVPRYMGPAEDLALMSRMPNLKVVQLLTAGYDNALRYLPAGVTLCNAGGVHDASTAELAVGLTLASLRGLDDFARAMPQGTWVYVRRESLADKRVLVVGAGGIGKALKARLEPFETDVILVGRSAREGVHGARDLRALLPAADVVILAVPLTDDTRGMVGTEFLAHMADGALLVNVSRGSVVDTEALTEQVASGRIRAALDVTEPEPLPPGHPLWTLPGVLISPHVGGNSTAFLPRARKLVADQLQRFAAGEPLASVVSS